MVSPICILGRRFTPEDLRQLQGWIDQRPGWSRRALSVALTELWDWRNGQGQLRDMAAPGAIRWPLKFPARRACASPGASLLQKRAALSGRSGTLATTLNRYLHSMEEREFCRWHLGSSVKLVRMLARCMLAEESCLKLSTKLMRPGADSSRPCWLPLIPGGSRSSEFGKPCGLRL